MSFPQVAHRIREKARKSLARGTLEGWERYHCPGPVPTLPALSERLATQTDTAWLARETEHLLAGQFAALGVTWPPRPPETLFPPDLWRLDPVTGDRWPGAGRYCFAIPYRHERRLGDIKFQSAYFGAGWPGCSLLPGSSTSLYAKPNEAIDFAEKIAELLADDERRARMGEIGRRRVENELAWSYEAPKLIAAYEHVGRG